MIQVKGLEISTKGKEKLSKRFDLGAVRKILINNMIEPLEFLKHSKVFRSSSNIIQEATNTIRRAIRCFGLSKEVKEIVIKTETELGVKLDIPDSLDLAKHIYTELGKYKKSGHILPEEVSFNDFDFLTKHNPALSASYISGTKPQNYEEIIAKYPSLTETFHKKQIAFNPIFLLLRQTREDYKTISEDLRHEFGHFWHNLEIGDETFHSKRMNNIDGFLSNDDIGFLFDLKNKLREKVCFINDLNIEPEAYENSSRIIPDIQNVINNRDSLELKDVITKDVINQFNQVIEKLEKLTDTTLKQFPDCQEEAVYALTSPKELIAFTIQKCHNHEYSQDFLNILRKHGIPKIKEISQNSL